MLIFHIWQTQMSCCFDLKKKIHFCFLSNRIKLEDALTLFQEYHADAFSLHTWNAFLQSRSDPGSDVCFAEIRDWLCGYPSGEPSADREVRGEVKNLHMTAWEHYKQEYDELKTLQVGQH
jgi:hypothetical protein